MIVLSEDQRCAVVAELSGAALKRLAAVGIDLRAARVLIHDHTAMLGIPDETPVIDGGGHIWLATHPFGDDMPEVWLCPFNDRMAYQVGPDRWHAMHQSSVPTFPLEILELPR